jgi:purine-nucleoside phosphorylase
MTGGPFPLDAALTSLRRWIPEPPDLFVVLGSGLSALAEGVADPVVVPFQDIPGFPGPSVAGHAGHLVFGLLEGRRVLFQAGRFHFYEGHSAEVVVARVRLAAALGAKGVILTNAAGGIVRDLEPGAIMILEDHLNLMGRSPLTGPPKGGEVRFPDMGEPYDRGYQAVALSLAADLGIPIVRGVYAGVLGPSYETPAEIRYLEGVGAHAVGMSTVPEAITASALGLPVLAFSLITNRAAGLGRGSLDHQEVLDVGREAGGRLETLIRAFVAAMPVDRR